MNLIFKTAFSAVFALVIFGHLPAQTNSVELSGKVVETQSGQAVPYATVAVMEKGTDAIVTGTTTGDKGRFELTVDDYQNKYIRVNFLGFVTKTIELSEAHNGHIDLGTIAISEDRQTLDEVQIMGEKSRTEFKLDKRVFNVGQDIASSGMGALEVLNNVPSVSVNIEGEISLRGRAGVQILINGKPSILADSQNNALGTITADMIESVEVITNPSAKYDAEGTAGILNIVLKKEEKRGLNGSITLNTGIPDNHNVGISLNRRTDKFNFFTQIGGGYRSVPIDRWSMNRNKLTDTTLTSQGTSYRNEAFYNISLGTDYHISDHDVITLTGRYAYEDEDQPSETEFREYTGEDVLVSAWNRKETTEATNPKWQYDLQYKRDFKDHKNHDLIFSALGSSFGKDLESEFVNTAASDGGITGLQQTQTNFDQTDYTFKLDYTRPINDTYTVEAGGQYQLNDVGNEYEVRNYMDGIWEVDPAYTNTFEYNQKVLAGYVTGSYEGEKWGLKLGLRAENTDLETVLTNTNQENDRNYTDLFPSAHSSYKFSDQFSFQAGYSRRIYRPRLWHLNPFFSIRDNYNIRRGNPDLQPEYTDSYELTGIFLFNKASFNAGVYHLYTTDVMERVNLFEGNVSTSMPMNIGENRNTGVEINGKYSPMDELTINGDFNYGFFVRKGEFQDQSFDFSDDQWTGKLTVKVNLPAAIDFEMSGNYRSKYRTVQGLRSEYTFVDLGVRKKLWNGKGVINLSVSDIFETRKWETNIDNEVFALSSTGSRGRFITLGFSYGFGKGDAMTYSGRGGYH